MPWRVPELFLIMLATAFFFNHHSVSGAQDPVGDEKLLAIITSDLHYARSGTTSDAIIAGMGFSDEITDAMISEIIDLHPDAFIMTGDNTNSGNPEDVVTLVEKLKCIKDEGIEIIITTGNHDLRNMKICTFPC